MRSLLIMIVSVLTAAGGAIFLLSRGQPPFTEASILEALPQPRDLPGGVQQIPLSLVGEEEKAWCGTGGGCRVTV